MSELEFHTKYMYETFSSQQKKPQTQSAHCLLEQIKGWFAVRQELDDFILYDYYGYTCLLQALYYLLVYFFL